MMYQGLLLAAAAAAASAHVTMNPNTGATAGTYFFIEMRIPHANDNYWTSKIELDVPPSVSSIRPEKFHGWDITIDNEDLEIPYTDGHGNEVTTRPSKITWEANHPDHTLHDDHLMRIGLSLKFKCDFADNNLHTIFNDLYTVWFPVTQHLSMQDSMTEVDVLAWTTTGAHPEGSGRWGALSSTPSPYVYLTSTGRCDCDDDSETGDACWAGESFRLEEDVDATQTWVSEQMDLLREDVNTQLESYVMREDINDQCMVEEEGRRRLSSSDCFGDDNDSSDSDNVKVAMGVGLGLGLGLVCGAAAFAAVRYGRGKNALKHSKLSEENKDEDASML